MYLRSDSAVGVFAVAMQPCSFIRQKQDTMDV